MKLAALDLGSNSFLCLIGSMDKSGKVVVEEDLLRVVRLGEGLSHSKKFHPEALARADEALSYFSQVIRKRQCDHVLAFATAAARDATNQDDFFRLCQKHQIPMEIISGGDEAQLTYGGALCEVDGLPKLNLQTTSHRLVIDIGGRSTEFVLGKQGKIQFARSLNMGCVGMTEKWVSQTPVTAEMRNQIQVEIQTIIAETMSEILGLIQGSGLDVIAVAGTPTTLASMEIGSYDVSRVEGYAFTGQQLEVFAQKLAAQTPKQIQQIYGIDPKRADVIYIGSEILCQIEKTISKIRPLGCPIKVSTKGIRYGVIMELMKRLTHQ